MRPIFTSIRGACANVSGLYANRRLCAGDSQQLAQIGFTEGDAAFGGFEPRRREMHENGAAARAVARHVIIAKHDEEVIKVIIAP